MEPSEDSLLACLRALNVSREKTVLDPEIEPQSKEPWKVDFPDGIPTMDLSGITPKLQPITYDFPDNKFLYEKGIVLKRLSDSEVVSIGRWCIPMISSGFTESGAAAILLVAYNLKTGKSGSWKYVYNEELIENSASDKPYDQFSNEVFRANGVYQSLGIGVGGAELDIEAAFYSYIAASLLRMATRSPDHYVNSWNHIYGGFSRFYGVNPPVRLPSPSKDAIEAIEMYYGGVGGPWKMTIYKILYAGSKDQQTASGLKKFLYDRYLEYTGFHIVGMLYRLCDIFNCRPEVVLGAVRSPLGKGDVKCFKKIIEMAASDDEEHKRNMWRYGAIFDELGTFMWNLRTKNSLKLAYTLGSALKEVAPAENSGVLNIVQLQRLRSEQQLECAMAGKELIKSIRESVAKNGESSGNQSNRYYRGN